MAGADFFAWVEEDSPRPKRFRPLNTSRDTKKKSLSEAFVNSFGAYPIGYGLGIVILPLSVGWIQEDPFTVNLVITGIYATVSFARSYFYRRLFERFGFDDNFIKLGMRLFRRVRPHSLKSAL